MLIQLFSAPFADTVTMSRQTPWTVGMLAVILWGFWLHLPAEAEYPKKVQELRCIAGELHIGLDLHPWMLPAALARSIEWIHKHLHLLKPVCKADSEMYAQTSNSTSPRTPGKVKAQISGGRWVAWNTIPRNMWSKDFERITANTTVQSTWTASINLIHKHFTPNGVTVRRILYFTLQCHIIWQNESWNYNHVVICDDQSSVRTLPCPGLLVDSR